MIGRLRGQGQTLKGAFIGMAIGGAVLILLGLIGGLGEVDKAPVPVRVISTVQPTASVEPPSITCEGDLCWWTELGRPAGR